MDIVEIVCYIVIPIITSLIGGIVGGLFTFLGVKMTITHERKTREEDLKLKQEEQKQNQIEKNIELNKKIKQTRPELTLTKNCENIKSIEEFCLLPYENPKLLDKEKMCFRYSDDIFKEEYWDKYEIILQNTGKREILVSFIQSPYESHANIYSKAELLSWKYGIARNYYNDVKMLPHNLHSGEKIKIIINYPKNLKELDNAPLDVFMHDEDGNFWMQPYVNFEREINSDILAPDAFYMHLRQECNKWYVYDYLYYAEDTEKCFVNDIRQVLDKRKMRLSNKENKHQQFRWDVNNGLICLEYNLPIN